jgi:hypothetical protein
VRQRAVARGGEVSSQRLGEEDDDVGMAGVGRLLRAARVNRGGECGEDDEGRAITAHGRNVVQAGSRALSGGAGSGPRACLSDERARGLPTPADYGAATATGVSFPTSVPSPNCPLDPSPQHQPFPLLATPQENAKPGLIESQVMPPETWTGEK